MAYMWLNLNVTYPSSLLGGLSDMHCSSAFATDEGNAFESQSGVAAVQASKVRRRGPCKHDFGHIRVSLKT